MNSPTYGTVGIGEPIGIRVVSGRSLFRNLSIKHFHCAMKIPFSQIMPNFDFSGCDIYDNRPISL
ncbi:hypothetical protein Hanom_Chr10g00881391 [Helianthus anomalus]